MEVDYMSKHTMKLVGILVLIGICCLLVIKLSFWWLTGAIVGCFVIPTITRDKVIAPFCIAIGVLLIIATVIIRLL